MTQHHRRLLAVELFLPGSAGYPMLFAILFVANEADLRIVSLSTSVSDYDMSFGHYRGDEQITWYYGPKFSSPSDTLECGSGTVVCWIFLRLRLLLSLTRLRTSHSKLYELHTNSCLGSRICNAPRRVYS